MNAILTVARKELRTYFKSPVALIFLGVFLVCNLFAFFGISHFFARNIADVRPLFEWLPLLLIFLVSAITMRQWAEERKLGTFEVLLTLPITSRQLVIGKFLAAIALAALALALTLPLPGMVAILGSLDWGPVIGGYVGALLLATTYVAIGLFVSARTDNVVVSLMVTLVVGGAIYMLGTDSFTALFGNAGTEMLRGLGTGSRFDSIERGVLDLRDLVYYAAITLLFLVLNWHFLENIRLDPDSREGRSRARRDLVFTSLIAANLVFLNLWLVPVTSSRADLTEDGKYSISPVTKDLLARLDEPLSIRGFFSERTHPALSPLVPEIRDLLAEYEVFGEKNVSVEIANPNEDEELEQEINEQYSIRSVPFRVQDRHQQAVVNSYFHVLVSYGDQYETLGFNDLVEVQADENGLDVRLKNFEYDLTRTIKRVSQDFQSVEATLAGITTGMTLEAYISPESIPDEFVELPERIRSVVNEIQGLVGDRLAFEEIDPTGDINLQEQLSDNYGIEPLAADFFARNVFYLDLLLRSGERFERILPRSDLSEADLRKSIEAGIRRLTPGQIKTVGVFTEIPEAPPPNPQIPPQFQPPPPQPDYRALQQLLSSDYVVEAPTLDDGIVPGHIDVLIVGKPGALSEMQRFAIDQYLMRGGKIITLAGHWTIDISNRSLDTKPGSANLEELLASYGVKVGESLVMDPHNSPFPVPVTKRQGPFRMQSIELLPYPFFADIREDGFAQKDHPTLSGLQNVTAPWASPLELVTVVGVQAEPILLSSEGSWLNSDGSIQPDLQQYPKQGFAAGEAEGPQVVAATLSGSFPSFYADRPSPLFDADPAAEGSAPNADRTGRTLKQSVNGAQLVVLGSSEIVSDLILQISGQTTGEVHRSNLQFLQNMVDWAVEDTDLLQIRSSGSFARTLRPITDGARRNWEIFQYLIAGILLILVAWLPRRAQQNARPMEFATQEKS